ncbi:MAG: hypothetical protein COA73_12720 [Candidatus Hydrogenedentota bacterium]|nr:MAG: hypothetical protein COA73_12720 [Candidatus Hydrogenedentota bacterium]
MRPNRVQYDTDAKWDDPFDKPEERRNAQRHPESFRIKLGVQLKEHPKPLVGPGVVQDISISGLRCRTKHNVQVGQILKVSIPTKEFPDTIGLPIGFVGDAHVVRTFADDPGVNQICIHFDEELATDMNFAHFIDQLPTLSGSDLDE